MFVQQCTLYGLVWAASMGKSCPDRQSGSFILLQSCIVWYYVIICITDICDTNDEVLGPGTPIEYLQVTDYKTNIYWHMGILFSRHNDGQIKSFFVGGPNQRKDYHIEEGEEVWLYRC